MKVSKKLQSIIGVILAIAMVITMLPNGQLVLAADKKMDVNIHFYDDGSYGGNVYFQYWDEGNATISTEESKEYFASWSCNRYPLVSETDQEGEGWYGLNVKGTMTGFQFLNKDASKYTGNVYGSLMSDFTELYYKEGKWYTENPDKNNAAKEAVVKPELKEEYYLVGSIGGATWSDKDTSHPLKKNEDGTYSITLKDIPAGKYEFKVLQDPLNFGWDYAWGGEGSGGNYELSLKGKSDVTISMNPKDDTYKLKVDTVSNSAADEVKSPVYNEDGTLTFYYEAAVSNAAIGVKGNLKSTSKKTLIKAEPANVTLSNGNYLYVATSGAIKSAGVYSYSFYELDEDGAIVKYKDADGNLVQKKLGDPASTTLYGDLAAFVRNPVVSAKGLVTIYYPYDGEGAQVYYKNVNSENEKTLQVGDEVTKDTAEKYGYTVVDIKEDDEFAGGGMYSAQFFDKDGTYSYVIVKDGKVVEDKYNYGENEFTEKDVDEAALAVNSPVVSKSDKGYSVKFMYYDVEGTVSSVNVAGGFNSWSPSADAMKQDENSSGIWSLEMDGFTPGTYQYKFVLNGGSWTQDPNCKIVYGNDANNVVIVPGLAPDKSIQVQKGEEVSLPQKAKLYTNSMTATEVEVTYKLKKATEGVTLENGVLRVSDDYSGDSVALVMSDGERTENYSVEVVGEMYTYTIHYYAEDNSVYANRDLWIWETNGKEYQTGYEFNEDVYTDSVGRKWATAKYSFPCNDMKVIVRSKGEWSYEEAIRKLEIAEGENSGEFWILQEGTQTFTEYAEEFNVGAKRYVIVEYNRPAGDYEGWNLYTWNATAAYNQISNMFTQVNGKYQTVFGIGEKTETIGYLLRDGTPVNDDWSKINKDMEGDRSITAPLSQRVIKVRLTQGSLVAEYLPFNKGYEIDSANKQIKFYYRDDDMFMDGTLETLKEVQVEINGINCKMAYNKANERYEYTMNNLADGNYEYCYNVTPASGAAVSVLDAFNTKTNATGTKSVVTYKNLSANVVVACTNAAISYDENTVMSIAMDNKEAEITEAYADLTALGGKSKVAIDPELKKLAISVSDDIQVGDKVVPVTAIDQYGNSHAGQTTITVKKRVKANSNDFDWDEAVIYFMMTDRFNDGNKANNDAYGVGDYNPEGPSSYHGGDFAGVTQKINEGYFDNLGINTIWITPVVENVLDNMQDSSTKIDSYGYTGYWAKNFTKLNAHLGTLEEFHTMINTAHDHGIRIMVDVVINHAGYKTDTEPSEFAGMLRGEEDRVADNDILSELDGLPDFLTEKAQVRKQLIAWQQAWVTNLGKTSRGDTIDYFRVDTVKHVESTTWSAFKNAMTEASSKFKMIGEYYGASYTDDFGYLNSGTMDSLLDFGFNDMANSFVTGSLESVEKQLEQRNAVIDNNGTFGSFINSHDETGLKTYLDSLTNENGSDKYTTAQADALAKVAASLYITAKGQPVIYYGEEIGLTGENNYPYSENRYDMKFNNLSETETAMLKHYQTLLSIRKSYSKVFAKGDRKTIGGSDKEQYMAFQRSYKGTNLVVALNITDTAKTVTLTVKDFAGQQIMDKYNNKTYSVNEKGQVTISIPANANGGTAVLVSDAEVAKSVITGKELTDAKSQAKTIKANAMDAGTGHVNATWTISKNDLSRVTASSLKDLNLNCIVSDTTVVTGAAAIFEKDTNNVSGAAITFAQEGLLSVNAKVKVNLANQSSIAYGSKVYVYRINGTKLEQIAIDTAKVTKDGYVTLYIAQGGTYVLLANEASSKVVTKLVNSVSVKFSGSTLKAGKSRSFSVKVPQTMKKVSSFSEANMKSVQSAQLAAKVTYSTSNKRIATVSSKGKVTAKKKGKATIKAIVRLSNGQKRVVSKKITVKQEKKKTKKTSKKTTSKKKS